MKKLCSQRENTSNILDVGLLHEVHHKTWIPEFVRGGWSDGGIQGHLHLPVGVTEHVTKLVLWYRE